MFSHSSGFGRFARVASVIRGGWMGDSKTRRPTFWTVVSLAQATQDDLEAGS
jgi:hypothetical protein